MVKKKILAKLKEKDAIIAALKLENQEIHRQLEEIAELKQTYEAGLKEIQSLKMQYTDAIRAAEKAKVKYSKEMTSVIASAKRDLLKKRK